MLQPRIGRLVATRAAQCHHVPKLCAHRRYATHVESSPLSASQFADAILAPVAPPPVQLQKDSTQVQGLMRTYKPRTPGVRHLKRPINDHLWKGRAYLPLTIPKKGMSKGGRNNRGRITVRHRGGGAKRRLRTVDFHRWETGPQLVERIEYDPGRSAHIALLTNQQSKKKTYIVAADGMRAGDIVQSYRSGLPQELIDKMGGVIDMGVLAANTCHRGNCLPLHLIPLGTTVYNIGSRPEGNAVFCRSAGTYGIVHAKDEDPDGEVTKKNKPKYVTVRLQSGEVRKVSRDACATIGVASNVLHHYRQLGKAGRSRWLGIRPTVRGVAMNAFEHAHGGGRGKSKGNVHPVSPWGQPAKGGYKTRRKHNVNKWVVEPRIRNVEKRRMAKIAKKR